LRQQLQGLTERLQRLETQPQPQMAPPPPAPPAPLAQSPANPQTQMSPLSPTDPLRPRQPFALYQQRGRGQLPFDMGVTGGFIGEEGLKEKGVEATWVPDFLPFYLMVLGGVFNGDNEVAFGRGLLTHPLATGRVVAFFDLTDTMALQAGASVANGETNERLRSTLLGYDLKFKYRPDGCLHPLLTLATEGIYSIRRTERGIDLDGDGSFDLFQKQTRNS